MIKLIASDLDGTLLQNGAQQLDASVFDMIEKLNQQGILFVAASGRQYTNLRRLFAPVADKIAYICENGAQVMYQSSCIFKSVMDQNVCLSLMEDIWNQGQLEILASTVKGSYVQPKNENYLIHVRDEVKNDVVIMDDFREMKEEIIKLSYYDVNGICEEDNQFFYNRYHDQVQITIGGASWYDFTAPGTNKGTALNHLLNHLSLSIKDCCVFGDNLNDLEMLTLVEESYAMDNGREEIKAVSKHICKNVEESIYDIIRMK